MRCYKCGRDLPPDSKFCQYCGEDLSKMRFCPFCGYQLREGMNFCAQCGNDLRTAAPAQPNGTQDTAPLQWEDAVPTWATAVTSETAPEERSEEQRETEYPEDAQDGTPEGTDPEEAIPESAGEEPASPLPDFGDGTEETGAADDFSRNRKKSKRKLAAVLCVIALIAGGVFLWRGGSGNRPKSVSEVAYSVLYLEVFDEDDALIGTASGFLVGDRSTLVTNYHVVQDADHIEAWTADMANSVYIDSILACDEVADLAVLHCNSIVKAEPLTLGDSERVWQGDKVYAVGYPLGLANTLSDGIVSSRYLDEYGIDIIQVTAAISGGNSGGPLLDTNGRVIGVMCASYIYGQNLNLAIASHTLEDLLASGFHKVSLADWDDRPEMPGYEQGEEEPEDVGEDVPDAAAEADEPEQSNAEKPHFVELEPEPPKPGQGTGAQESKPAAPTAPDTENTGTSETDDPGSEVPAFQPMNPNWTDAMKANVDPHFHGTWNCRLVDNFEDQNEIELAGTRNSLYTFDLNHGVMTTLIRGDVNNRQYFSSTDQKDTICKYYENEYCTAVTTYVLVSDNTIYSIYIVTQKDDGSQSEMDYIFEKVSDLAYDSGAYM